MEESGNYRKLAKLKEKIIQGHRISGQLLQDIKRTTGLIWEECKPVELCSLSFQPEASVSL